MTDQQVVPAPTIKPKREVRSYDAETRASVIKRLAAGQSQQAIANAVGIPQQTIAQWSVDAGLGRRKTNSLAKRVQARIQEQVVAIANRASGDVERLLADSLAFGNRVLQQANGFVDIVGPDGLAQVATAGKTGVSIARQALGLNDTTEKVIVRVDLIGQASQEQPVIDVQSSPVAGPTTQPVVVQPNNPEV